MKNSHYHVIDRKGNIVFSSAHLLSMIGESGLCLIENDNAPSIYNVNNHQMSSLPTHIAGKQVVYRVDWTYPIEDTIVGYLVENVNSRWQRNLLDREYTPDGTRCIASVALDKDFRPLFDPLPLKIHPYKGEWTLAEDYNKRLFLLDRQGEIIRKFPNDWRLHHRFYNESGNLAELIVYKSADKKCIHPPLYHYDIQTDSLRGPYLEVCALQEGIRAVTDMDSNTYFVDAKWNIVFTCQHLRKRTPFYLLSDCSHGHIAFFSVLKAGLLNKLGEVVVKPTYSEIQPIGDSLWWYKKNHCYGIMRENGDVITAPQYMISYSQHFRNGLVAVYNKNDKGGYINHEAEWVIPPAFDACYTFIHPQYTIART